MFRLDYREQGIKHETKKQEGHTVSFIKNIKAVFFKMPGCISAFRRQNCEHFADYNTQTFAFLTVPLKPGTIKSLHSLTTSENRHTC